jgi:hypothetical protein
MDTNDLRKHVMQYLSGVGRPAAIVSAQTVEKAEGGPGSIVVEVCDPRGSNGEPYRLLMIEFKEIG